MKNKLTLSELRNVIKEEIRFQMKKRELFENLDKKSLNRILREIEESDENTMTTIKIESKTYGITFSRDDKNYKYPIISTNENDEITPIADSAITSNEGSSFKVVFDVSLPKRIAENKTYIDNTLKPTLEKSIIVGTKSLSLAYVPFMTIPSTNERIEVVKANIIIKYPADILKLTSPETGKLFTPKDIFDLTKFKGKPL
jgi:hypothetical protein